MGIHAPTKLVNFAAAGGLRADDTKQLEGLRLQDVRMPVQFRFYFGDSPIVSDKFGPGESNCELVVSRSDDGTFYLTDHTPKAIALINQQTRWAVQDSKDVLAFAVHMIRAVNGTVLKNVRDA